MNKIFLRCLLLLVSLAAVSGADPEPGIRIRAVGDIMLGTATPAGFLRPEAKGNILKYINPVLCDADLTVGNLEGTLCDSGTTYKCEPDSLDCYVFRMPEMYGGDLKTAGFDFLSLANNHVGDFGYDCVTRTERILDSLSIGWSGRPGSSATKIVNGFNVAFIAFHSGGYCNSSLDIPAAVEMIAQLKSEHELVIVSIHGGAEGLVAMSLPDSMELYMGEERGHLKEFTHQMVDAGADLVFGHGPHVARAMEVYHGKLIAYSLANFATYGRFNLQEERRFGGILEVELSKTGVLISGRIISIEQKYWGVPLWDREHRFAHLVDSLSRIDLPETGVRINSQGYLMLE
ncbi:MAG: CapA family protein [Candidatus Marinimicrobia bacterium]|nr:CapA family protein [Candidatus Neomarinimicrobiota bacterium]